jgi:hypothetical protein
MMEDAHDRVAKSVRQRLLNLTKARNEDYNLVLTRYALERFLYRLSLSQHRQELILKGAMLFQIWSQTPHRATKDLDLLASCDVTKDAIAARIVGICATAVEEDGLRFDADALAATDVREDDRYGWGTRKICCQIGFG